LSSSEATRQPSPDQACDVLLKKRQTGRVPLASGTVSWKVIRIGEEGERPATLRGGGVQAPREHAP
jgi:hypothetical protein